MAEFDFAPLTPPAPAAPPEDVGAIVAAAHAEAAAIREAAYAEGLAAGREEALAAVTPALAALDQAVAEARAHADGVAARFEGEAVDLAFAVAEKVVAAAIDADPSAVLEAVRGALRGIVERERVTLLVNPADLDLVRAASAELRASLGGIDHCEVQAERRVGRGGAVVRFGDGQVDARIETKLERAREVVAVALSPASPS
jgi:flagellar biosynthesis/type III secretory pathway protein FliH